MAASTGAISAPVRARPPFAGAPVLDGVEVVGAELVGSGVCVGLSVGPGVSVGGSVGSGVSVGGSVGVVSAGVMLAWPLSKLTAATPVSTKSGSRPTRRRCPLNKRPQGF